jgi:hypothetical protein
VSAVPEVAEAVRRAVVQLERDFQVSLEPIGDGGAILTVRDLDIGERWQPTPIDLTFEVAFNYPYAAIYPFYTTSELARADGGAWPSALQHVAWRGAQRTQVSLRANRWNPQVDTAYGAVMQVTRWFRTVP